mgnify:CR=1 FL=1
MIPLGVEFRLMVKISGKYHCPHFAAASAGYSRILFFLPHQLKTIFPTVHQKYLKESARKNRRKKRVQDPNKPKRAPSGFAKPALISSQLCSFLGKTEGTEMARTEVTKFLTTYIKEHNLQDPTNKRRILPDKKLGKLLNAKKDEEVTYFNLQKYMKVHYPNKEGVYIHA